MRAGIALLVVASLILIGASAYSYHGAKNPRDATFYQPFSRLDIVPRISPVEIIVFVVVEHVLVGLGIALILKAS